MSRPRLGRCLLALSALLVAVACTNGQSTQPSDVPSADSNEQSGSSGDEGFVRLTLRLSPDDALFLLLAEETLVSRCMAERGFLYEVMELPPASEAFDDRPPTWTSAPDVEAARVNGYGLSISLVSPQGSTDSEGEFDVAPGAETGTNSHVLSMPAEERAAWMSALRGTRENMLEVPGAGELGEAAFIPTDGCEAEMQRELYGDLEAWFQVEAAVFSALSSDQSDYFSDERVVAAGAVWVACMRDRGYAVDTAEDATDLAEVAYEERPIEEARTVEVAIAVADSECVEASGVNRLLLEAEVAYEERLVREHAALFASLQRLQEAAVARGRQLLGQP